MEVDENVKPEHLRIPDNPPNLYEETTFPNPFEHPGHGHFYRHGSALIITGLPGIGQFCRAVGVLQYPLIIV